MREWSEGEERLSESGCWRGREGRRGENEWERESVCMAYMMHLFDAGG